MSVFSLEQLVKLAKTDYRQAEAALLPFLQKLFPQLQITTCAINHGSKVALNSVNGFLDTQAGRKLFFKFHAEEGEQASLENAEYYRAEMLEKFGWPVISPCGKSTTPGMQCVIYDRIDAPTAYDVCGALDAGYLKTGAYDPALYARVLKAEEAYLRRTTAIMIDNLAPPAPESAAAPLHQLFSHRLHSVGGAVPRLKLFYEGQTVTLPDGTPMPFDDLAKLRWAINGQTMPHTLADIIAASKKDLHAETAAVQATTVSHGDDHNGNKFLIGGTFTTFDPAFAGRHPALLAPIKATLHNALLHPFWYYEPERVHDALEVGFRMEDDALHITHNGETVLKSPLRAAILALHQELVWQPLLVALKARGWLPDTADDFLRAAAFCCPFLALNMIDAGRLSRKPQLALFNLAQCVALYHAPHLTKAGYG